MKASPLILCGLLACLCALPGCVVAPLIISGTVAGGGMIGAEIESNKQKGQRDDGWDYADEVFTRGRNRTAAPDMYRNGSGGGPPPPRPDAASIPGLIPPPPHAQETE